jgi:6-phosphogluconolactonase
VQGKKMQGTKGDSSGVCDCSKGGATNRVIQYLKETFMFVAKLAKSVPCGILTVLLFGAAVFCKPTPAAGAGFPGAVYVMTNQTSGNSIMAFNRAPDGALTSLGTFPTGGLGMGSGNDPLGSQNSMILSSDGHFLFAVNAGSNDISVMAVGRTGLSVVDKVASGGTEPTSLTLYRDLLYVLNAGGTPNVTGFILGPEGKLSRLPGSTRSLAGGSAAAPAQVGFSPDGSSLVVTEKDTNLIDTYRVLPNGLTDGPFSNASSGATPFGFVFGQSNTLVVSEAAGGPNGTSATSSYRISPSGRLITLSGSVGDTQMAACWAAVTNNGRVVYISNSASNSLSAYEVTNGGSLVLLNAMAATTGSVPLDSALSSSGLYLYVLDDASGEVSAYRVQPDGALVPIAGASGLPAGSQGIAAR